jgi:predicted metal-dependent phosphoesterase TrpH
MPAGQPFTSLCQQLARPRFADRADLHLHSTWSDGTYTPAELVELACRCGLAAIALTDHDTSGGVASARQAAQRTGLEVIAGAEITTEYAQRELHLLAFFLDREHAGLSRALERIRQSRSDRFQTMLERLRARGVSIDEEGIRGAGGPDALGRRHLAELLVRQGRVSSIREAFTRYLSEPGEIVVPKWRLPVAEALELVRGAGGVAAWAHPPYDCTRESLAALRAQGLGAVEAEYPELSRSRTRQLRAWADELGLAVTGGSDCHGPGKRSVGACTVSAADLEQLRRMVR